MHKQNHTLKVNGDTYEVAAAPWRTLDEVLRDELHLTGTKVGCKTGDCGACTVLLDGKAVSSCLTLAVEAAGREILTIEGLAPKGDELHPLQQAFVAHGAVQCGYCSPGMILAAKHLLDRIPSPTHEQIRKGLSGNLCRCTGYNKIVEAIASVAQRK
ncbi:MAG: (2Fe-2S)-binding protein [Myxococcaceae bacterium]